MTEAQYATALHDLIAMAPEDYSTAQRVRQMLLSLLIDGGSHVELGALLRGADRNNTRAILTVLGGWQSFGWRHIEGVPDADDFIRDMSAIGKAA